MPELPDKDVTIHILIDGRTGEVTITVTDTLTGMMEQTKFDASHQPQETFQLIHILGKLDYFKWEVV